MTKKETKVWLDKNQIQILEESCKRLKDRAIVQLGAWVGLRANEIAGVKVSDLREYNIENGLQHFLRVSGKRTNQPKGKGLKKEREAYVPNRIYSDLIMLKNENTLKEKDPLVPNKFGDHYTPDGIRERVYSVSKLAYDRTSDQDFKYVSSHDLRRFFAHYNLEELGKNPRVIMNVGGWDSWEAIEPYLEKPSRNAIVRELNNLG